MNISVKKRTPFEVRKNLLSALILICTFAGVYLSFLFGVAGTNPALQNPPFTGIVTAKTQATSPEQKLPLDAAFKRETPLYISDSMGESANIHEKTLSVYFHKNATAKEIPLEEYVLGALLAEMPTSYDIEALKAQAVACRTYALYKAQFCPPHSNGEVICTDYAHCQSYISPDEVSPERLEIAKNAVGQTKGIIMLYEDKPILAVFHAASVGSTLSSAQVWGGELPYLVPVKTSEDAFMNVTKKNGHGVGMSQYGAQCLAVEGYDFYAILSHYYTGVEFGMAE